jgi:putative signal transducing protein
MYCPQCGVEYGDGFTECSDCHNPLVSGTCAPDPQDHSTQLSNLVIVLETSDRIQLAMAKGLLEDAGIPLFIHGQIATLVQEVDGFLHKRVRLQVPRDREAEARELLEQLVQRAAQDPADPPTKT